MHTKTLVQMHRDEKTLSITDIGARCFTLGLLIFVVVVCHACELGFWEIECMSICFFVCFFG